MENPPNKSGQAKKAESYKNKLRNFISYRVRSKEDVQDILQEVMYQVAKADFLIQPIEQLESWLYSVTRNKIIDWSRKKKPIPVSNLLLYEDTDEEEAGDNIEEILFNEASTPEDTYIQGVFWKELNSALSELPKEQSDIYKMTELEGLSFHEISEKTGIAENTLISRKHYAVLFLRKKLRSLYSEFTEE